MIPSATWTDHATKSDARSQRREGEERLPRLLHVVHLLLPLQPRLRLPTQSNRHEIFAAVFVSVLVNPADAVRTGALLGLQGTTAFGSASLVFLRFTKGPVGAACLLSLSVLLWIAVPFAAAEVPAIPRGALRSSFSELPLETPSLWMPPAAAWR